MIVIAFWSWSFSWNKCVLGSRWHLTLQNLTPRDIRHSPADKKHQVTGSVSQTPLSGTSVSLFLWPSFYSSAEVVTGPSLETQIIPGPVVCGNWPQKGIPCIPTEEHFLLKPQKEPPLSLLVGRSWSRVRGQLFVFTFCFFTRSFCTSVAQSPWKGSQKEAPFPHIPLGPDSEIIRHTHLPLHFLPAQFKSTVSCCSFDLEPFVQRRQEDCFYLYANTLSILQSPRKFPFNQMTYTSISSCIKLMVRG